MAGHQEHAPLVCLISGVTTELGRTIAYTFAEEGGRPVLVGQSDEREELGKVRTFIELRVFQLRMPSKFSWPPVARGSPCRLEDSLHSVGTLLVRP